MPFVCNVNGGQFNLQGTGFVVGSIIDVKTFKPYWLLLTCHHLNIQDSIRNKKQCAVEFNRHSESQPFTVNVCPHVYAENAWLDYVLLCLELSDELDTYLSEKEKLATYIYDEKPSVRDPLVIVGHPEGTGMRVDPSVYCVSRPEDTVDYNCGVWYQCCTFHGGSGSPCLSVKKKLLYAMHSGGTGKPGAQREGEVEYGVHLWAIINDIKKQVENQTNTDGTHLRMDGLYELFPQLKRS